MRRKLTQIDKFTIDGAFRSGMSPDKIASTLAKKLGLAEKPVADYLAVLSIESESAPAEQTQVTAPTLHTTVGGRKGISVMTKNGSEAGDELNIKMRGKGPPQRDCIKQAKP